MVKIIQQILDIVKNFLTSGTDKKFLQSSASTDKIVSNASVSKFNQNTVSDLPKFVKGEANLAGSPNALKVREFIKDEFGGGRNGWALQCTEYVQYKITQTGINIVWPVRNNRNGGNWPTIFTKYDKYNVLNEPKNNCAVSFSASEKNPFGHIAFVEQVNEDGSIKISEANWPKDGIYRDDRILSKQDWQEKYKCHFIDFACNSYHQKEESILGASMATNKKTIFLSYADQDKLLAKKIKSYLEPYKFDIFIACEDLKLGEDWLERIKKEVKDRHFFAALQTKNFYNSTIAQQECNWAIARDKEIIPLFVDRGIIKKSIFNGVQGIILNKRNLRKSCMDLVRKINL